MTEATQTLTESEPMTDTPEAIRKNITQPADWWQAFEAEAERRGLNLSQFLGLAGLELLPAKTKRKLSERIRPGRKKNE